MSSRKPFLRTHIHNNRTCLMERSRFRKRKRPALFKYLHNLTRLRFSLPRQPIRNPPMPAFCEYTLQST